MAMKIPHCTWPEFARDFALFLLVCPVASVGIVSAGLAMATPVDQLLSGSCTWSSHCGVDVPAISLGLSSYRERRGQFPNSLEELVDEQIFQRVPEARWGRWGYQRVGDGARLFNETPLGHYEAWIYSSGHILAMGCAHRGHDTRQWAQ
jgi:hypothetical protein